MGTTKKLEYTVEGRKYTVETDLPATAQDVIENREYYYSIYANDRPNQLRWYSAKVIYVYHEDGKFYADVTLRGSTFFFTKVTERKFNSLLRTITKKLVAQLIEGHVF